MKQCVECKENKSLDMFHKRAASKDGVQSRCKECNKAKAKQWQADNAEKHEAYWRERDTNLEYVGKRQFANRARRYGLSVDELHAMMARADGKCEICKEAPLRWLVVDHCHNSLKVRGVLCERCNQALGLFRDNIEFMKSAVEYLNK